MSISGLGFSANKKDTPASPRVVVEVVHVHKKKRTKIKTMAMPNKFRYEIKRIRETPYHVLVEVNFPDAAPAYNQNKILLYGIYEWRNLQKYIAECGIDPHFLDNEMSPFARFEPTAFGWSAAKSYMNSHAKKEAGKQ